MEKYKNLSRKSDVDSFEIGEDYIIVAFCSGRKRSYLYTYLVTGWAAVEKMKELAREGIGLGRMLATKPYYKYAEKW